MVTEGVTVGVTDIVMVLELAVVGETHGAFEVRITVTLSPLLKVVEVKVAPVPALLPFTCHW